MGGAVVHIKAVTPHPTHGTVWYGTVYIYDLVRYGMVTCFCWLQVKADARSENNRRLQMAGAQVKKATETLVKAAQQASANVQEDEPFMAPKVGDRMDGWVG